MQLSPQDRERIFQEEKARRERRVKPGSSIGCWVIGAIIVALLILSSKIPDRDDDVTAYVMAETFIKRRLKAPGTAEFPSPAWDKEAVRIIKLDTGGYRVSAWVDAQNSFGAKLRKHWVCELKSTSSGSWEVTGFCDLLE